jgi:hypothetical protein
MYCKERPGDTAPKLAHRLLFPVMHPGSARSQNWEPRTHAGRRSTYTRQLNQIANHQPGTHRAGRNMRCAPVDAQIGAQIPRR